jgi:hypothetical protein
MKDLDVDGLKDAIKLKLGTDFTGSASAIKIYDHQGQAMEHPGQAVSPNTSETPYLYQLPIVWVRDRSDASPYPLILPVLNVAHMRQAVKARLQGEQASVKESAIEIYDHQEQAMAAEQSVDDAAALRPNSPLSAGCRQRRSRWTWCSAKKKLSTVARSAGSPSMSTATPR